MPESVERAARHKSVSGRVATRCLGLAVALGMVLVMWGPQATSSLALDSGASPDTLAHALAESVEVASSSPEAPVPPHPSPRLPGSGPKPCVESHPGAGACALCGAWRDG